ncbi:hypothetical protein [Spirosoma harenae]
MVVRLGAKQQITKLNPERTAHERLVEVVDDGFVGQVVYFSRERVATLPKGLFDR